MKIEYIQDKPFGIGKLFIDGNRVDRLIDIKIHAHTKESGHAEPLEIEVVRSHTIEEHGGKINSFFESLNV